MSKVDGARILMSVNGTNLVGLTDNSFDYSVDTFETTTKDSNMHKEYLAGEDGATVNFSGLYDTSGSIGLKDLLDLAKAKTAIPIVHGYMVAGGLICSGYGIINSVSWTNGKNEASGFSGTIQMTGEITFATYSDATAPLFEAAWVNNASPTILRLKFSEELDPNYIVAGTAFSSDGSSSGAKNVVSVEISKDKLYLTMDEAYVGGDTITVQYTKPGSGIDIRDKSGNQVASFGPEAVTNNITA